VNYIIFGIIFLSFLATKINSPTIILLSVCY